MEIGNVAQTNGERNTLNVVASPNPRGTQFGAVTELAGRGQGVAGFQQVMSAQVHDDDYTDRFQSPRHEPMGKENPQVMPWAGFLEMLEVANRDSRRGVEFVTTEWNLTRMFEWTRRPLEVAAT